MSVQQGSRWVSGTATTGYATLIKAKVVRCRVHCQTCTGAHEGRADQALPHATLILSVDHSHARAHVRTCHHVNANTCSHARVTRRLAITDFQTEPSCVVLSIMSAPPIRSRDDRKRKKTNAPKPISEPIVAPKSSSQPSTAGASQASDIRRWGQSCSPSPRHADCQIRSAIFATFCCARGSGMHGHNSMHVGQTCNTISRTRSSITTTTCIGTIKHTINHHLVPPTLTMPHSTSLYLSSLLSLDATAATAVGCRRSRCGVRCRG